MNATDKTLTPRGPTAERPSTADDDRDFPGQAGPEVPPGMEEVQEWDEAAGTTGMRVEPVRPEDESATDSLVEEGMEEADRELRLEANTELEEEEESVDSDTVPPTTGILS